MSKVKSKTPQTDKKAETILNRITEQKKELLIQFRKNPVLQSVCHRVGISRSTVYRWMGEDSTFCRLVKQAQNEGNEFVADMAKSQVIKQISEGNLTASFFWLKTRKKEEFAESVLHEHRLVKDISDVFTPEMHKQHIAAHLRMMSGYMDKKTDHFNVERAVRRAWEKIDEDEKTRKDRERKMREQLEGVSED